MHICVSEIIIIGSDNGLSPGRRQAIIWTNAGILLNGPLGIYFNEIVIEINTFYSRKCIWKCHLRNGGTLVRYWNTVYIHTAHCKIMHQGGVSILKILPSQNRDPHDKNKTVSIPGKMVLYWLSYFYHNVIPSLRRHFLRVVIQYIANFQGLRMFSI